ncbi:SDR family oxidoreductase, partial [Klebsiella pneumoniae]
DRPGESHEVVSTALFLASSEASFITGTDVVVDGGLLAH